MPLWDHFICCLSVGLSRFAFAGAICILWNTGSIESAVNQLKNNIIFHFRFFNLILLPRIRDDISEYKRLNFHLYMVC